ncbi:MAG TPA: MauE/DoxX family redox-associated membrane protein [bacterium]|jgi:uncharacterized membrane protein YphA (DoxX/SURF4 family)|nr:MauE/DoxX family redox-associated membrane protein [bacterium]
MNLQAHLTDPLLCLLGFLLLAAWMGVKKSGGPSGKRGTGHGWEPVVATLLRVVSGLILIFASLDKLGDPASFAQMVANYQILSAYLIPLASVVIPWLEFFTGLFLVFGFRYRGAAFVFCALMGLYALAIAFDLLRGVDINCGCGLTDPSENATWWSVLRDVEFFSIGFIVMVSPLTHAALDRWSGE